MPDIKLAKLPDRTPVKLAISILPELHEALQDYARLYQDTYGHAEALPDLIPHMLAAFLDSDRAFAKTRSRSAASSRPPA